MERIIKYKKETYFLKDKFSENVLRSEAELFNNNPKDYKLLNFLIEKYFQMIKEEEAFQKSQIEINKIINKSINKKDFSLKEAQELYAIYKEDFKKLENTQKILKGKLKSKKLQEAITIKEFFKDEINTLKPYDKGTRSSYMMIVERIVGRDITKNIESLNIENKDLEYIYNGKLYERKLFSLMEDFATHYNSIDKSTTEGKKQIEFLEKALNEQNITYEIQIDKTLRYKIAKHYQNSLFNDEELTA